jgi:hypothetical protein
VDYLDKIQKLIHISVDKPSITNCYVAFNIIKINIILAKTL